MITMIYASNHGGKMNQVVLVGKIKIVGELKEVKGYPLSHIVLSLKKDYMKEESEIDTDDFKVLLWKQLAKENAEVLKKDMLVSIKGRLQPHNYQKDADSPLFYGCEIVAEKINRIND
ncbi:hypothetical protein EII25_02750 [Erysipelotrichaceae bacterium OH741_COT-311]|nr:hypothetical protein EII25_02750 [Erysipelotrichaceae bacterium OH741_COT-311]